MLLCIFIYDEVYLAEVGALLRDGEVAFLVGAAEEPCVLHKVGLLVVGLLAAQPHPEEVVWLLALIHHLQAEPHLHKKTTTLSVSQHFEQ